MKRRLDTLLAERGLAGSRSAAAREIRAGRVRIGADGPRALRPSEMVDQAAELTIDPGRRFASRGGDKLDPALEALGVDPTGLSCLDVGASTGGFTDCLLKRGADTVIALDVGHGQLDWDLRNDARVVVIERFNARHLTASDLPYRPELVTADVSFISLTKLMAPIASVLATGGRVLAMVKPQFELGPERVGRNGVVLDPEARRDAVRSVVESGTAHGLVTQGIARAGLAGPKGNREVFVLMGPQPSGFDLERALVEVVM